MSAQSVYKTFLTIYLKFNMKFHSHAVIKLNFKMLFVKKINGQFAEHWRHTVTVT